MSTPGEQVFVSIAAAQKIVAGDPGQLGMQGLSYQRGGRGTWYAMVSLCASVCSGTNGVAALVETNVNYTQIGPI